jgi:hypothetical protein
MARADTPEVLQSAERRRKTAKNLKQFVAASSGKSVAVPVWIAGDHFMVGWGRVETIPPALLFVDTGLAGAGVKLVESVIKEAGSRGGRQSWTLLSTAVFA